jgi:hypothetical protein
LNVLSKLQSEVGRFGKILDMIMAKMQMGDGERKTEETETEPTKATPSSRTPTTAAIKAESTSRSDRRTAFATSLSSAFANKKAKSKKAKKKSTKKTPKRKPTDTKANKSVTQKAGTSSWEEEQTAALEEMHQRLSILDDLSQTASLREKVTALGLGYRSPISDAEEID